MQTIRQRLAERRVPSRYGTGLFVDSLPKVWDLNYLAVDGALEASAQELAAEADALQGPAGHGHRKVVVDDEPTGRRLRPGFEALGWQTEANLVMVHRRPPDRSADTGLVREVSEDELQWVRERGMRTEPWAAGDPGSVRQVLASWYLLDRATDVRRFAAFADGRPVSYCDLYSDGATAQIETVGTLEEYRNRGLARTVVTKALDEAKADGHDLVFLVADEEDWPKELYVKLGFDPVGVTYNFNRTRETELQAAIRHLLTQTGASRVTLRRDVPDRYFPVIHEALAPGVKSIRDGAGIDLRNQPVARQLEETGAQVIQNDSASAFDDPAFQRMREAYGGLAAQIVTPVLREGRLVAIVSLHQLDRPRVWTPEEIALAAQTGERVREILSA